MRLPAFLAVFLSLVLGNWSLVIPAHAAPRPPLLFPPAAGQTDLVADPAIITGTFSNGVRYAIRPNAEPRSRAALRLVVAAGSLHETDAQRGLAHFLEHMAFNGSAHYAPGTLIEFFQRMGMNFGGDTNAYTSFDRTVYMLDLPDTKPETLAEGARVLADYAGHLLLLPEEIDRERGVVLSEKLARDSADYRAAVAGYEFFYRGTILPQRLPIGVEQVLKTADRPLFADFYDAWYRPERLAVIAVGDLDPAVAEKSLREAFTPLAARAPARPAPELGLPDAAREPSSATGSAPRLRLGYHFEKEASATTVTLAALRAPDLSPDSAARRLRDLPRDLAFAMLNLRLAELAKAETSPFVRASAGPDSFPGLHDGAELQLVARPGKWAESLAVGENELRRALRFGFRDPELREAVATVRNALDQALKTDSTRRSEERADALVDAFIEGTIPTAPAADLALYGPALDAITVADCHEALKAAWSTPGGRLVGVFGNTDLGADAAPALAISQAYEAAEAAEVAPPAERADAPWSYTAFGPAGNVVERREVSDLGITEVVFGNGVRLNLKRTDFEAGTIALQARVGVGQLDEPRDQPGLAFFGNIAFTAGGLGRHSADELRRILAGRNVGVGLQIADDALVFSGQTTPADLVLELQLLAAYLSDPGYRAEAELTARRQMEPYFARLATDPRGTLQLATARILASGDTRIGHPSRADASARTLAELRAWLAPKLTNGPIEISLIGDLDPDAVIAAVADTVGALPARQPRLALDDLRKVTVSPPGDLDLAFDGTIEKVLLAVYWPTADGSDIHRTRRLRLLAEIFGDRLRKSVREEIGGSYSPFAASLADDTYRDFGFIFAQVATDPADLPKVRAAVLAAAADLAAHGVTEEELARARQPVLTSLRETERTNAYWLLNVLAAAQEQPWRLDWARSRYSDHEAITKAELDALAVAYLGDARAIRVTIRPATAP